MTHRTPSSVVLWTVTALWPAAAIAQTDFTEVSPTTGLWVTNEAEDFWVNAVAPADVDADGDIDLAMIGMFVVYNVSVEDRLVLFFNEGPDGSGRWVFTETPVPLGDLWAGASDLAWGDHDGDGDPDLMVASEGAMALYRNEAGTLTRTSTVLPAYLEDSSYDSAYDLRSLTWADFDNDNDVDLLVPSVVDLTTFEYRTLLLRNDGAGAADDWIFTDVGAAFDPTVHAHTAWADDDGDRDLDVFVTNVDPYTETGFIRRFRNDAGAFVGADLLGIKVEWGLADWGDYDADGDLDVLVAGNIQEADGSYATVLRTYRNDGTGYSETTIPGDWLDIHAATWADYDSDGDVDLLVTGSFVDTVLAEIVGRSKVYANAGNEFSDTGVFLPAPISSIGRGGSFTWFDLDGDGDLDYFVAGAYFVPGGNGLVEAQMHLFRNDAPGSNTPPEPPQSPEADPDGSGPPPALVVANGGPEILRGTVGGLGVTLSWEAASDDHTPASALTYDLEVHPVGMTLAAAQRLPEPGNVGHMTTWRLDGLTHGDYAWSVRAVDSAFVAGPRAEGRFTIGGAPDGGPAEGDDAGVAAGDGEGDGCSCRVADGDCAPGRFSIFWLAALVAAARRRNRRPTSRACGSASRSATSRRPRPVPSSTAPIPRCAWIPAWARRWRSAAGGASKTRRWATRRRLSASAWPRRPATWPAARCCTPSPRGTRCRAWPAPRTARCCSPSASGSSASRFPPWARAAAGSGSRRAPTP
jgi:hypothetical protein